MTEPQVLQLAQDLEWLGCEEQYFEQSRILDAPERFFERQREVISTADKIERELMTRVRFNPSPLIGINYSLGETLDALIELLTSIQGIRQSALHATHELPDQVRKFRRMAQSYFNDATPLMA
jgi:hypothetical protein